MEPPSEPPRSWRWATWMIKVFVEALAGFLRDPAWEVRRAAMEALLWDTESRWAWIRHLVRQALSDPIYQGDGPLRHDGQLFTPEAVTDLTAWSEEKGCLGDRAAQTLGRHYSRALSAGTSGPRVVRRVEATVGRHADRRRSAGGAGPAVARQRGAGPRNADAAAQPSQPRSAAFAGR